MYLMEFKLRYSINKLVISVHLIKWSRVTKLLIVLGGWFNKTNSSDSDLFKIAKASHLFASLKKFLTSVWRIIHSEYLQSFARELEHSLSNICTLISPAAFYLLPQHAPQDLTLNSLIIIVIQTSKMELLAVLIFIIL